MQPRLLPCPCTTSAIFCTDPLPAVLGSVTAPQLPACRPSGSRQHAMQATVTARCRAWCRIGLHEQSCRGLDGPAARAAGCARSPARDPAKGAGQDRHRAGLQRGPAAPRGLPGRARALALSRWGRMLSHLSTWWLMHAGACGSARCSISASFCRCGVVLHACPPWHPGHRAVLLYPRNSTSVRLAQLT